MKDWEGREIRMEQKREEQDVLRDVRRELYLTEGLSEMDDDALRSLIRRILLQQNPERDFSGDERNRLVETLFGNFRGLGILEEYLNDDKVSEIMVNAWDVLFIEQSGVVERSPRTFSSEKELEDIIQRIVAGAGREVNRANPIVDTRLPGGERVNVVLPPASIETPVVTIRRFPKERITMQTLVEYGTLTEEAATFLEGLVKAKYNIFISGGTSSGKTTFLNALSDYIPKSERIITIEDSAELQLTGIDNLVRLETRNSNTTGSGEITIRELIRTSLRMRPERIIVGEVRGEEALDMLGAMNTGHDGSLSTGHANSCEDMLRRLETMVMQGNSGLPLPAVRRNIASSIDLIVHLGRLSSRERVVLEITEVEGLEGEEIVLNRLYERMAGTLVPTGNKMVHTWKQEVYGREKTAQKSAVRVRKVGARRKPLVEDHSGEEHSTEEPDPNNPYFFF